MPGFALAKKCSEVGQGELDVDGLILLKHGIFSMGATAEEAYVRMIDRDQRRAAARQGDTQDLPGRHFARDRRERRRDRADPCAG